MTTNDNIQNFLDAELEELNTNSDEPTELLVPQNSGVAFLDPANFPDLDEAEVGVSMETKYFEFNQPDMVVRAIFNGLGVMKKRNASGELDEIPAIYFQTKDGVYLNGGDNLVEQLRHVKAGTPIQITYLGKQTTKSGNKVNKFDVRLLNVKPTNPF
jgi:hypothetical protein